MKIRVLIVEDNSLVAEAIGILLRNHGMEPIGACESGEDAVKVFKENDVDLVLMDIILAGKMDGIAAAALIQQHRPVPIIYLTDHVDEKKLKRAKQTFPANYLTKPYDEAGLVRAIEIAFNNAHEASRHASNANPPEDVFVRTDNQQFVKIPFREILYLEASRSYCKVVTGNHTYTLCSSMNQVHEKFGNGDFVRVHRSYVVNTKRITKLDGNVIFLDERKVDMGKEFRDDLMSSLKLIK